MDSRAITGATLPLEGSGQTVIGIQRPSASGATAGEMPGGEPQPGCNLSVISATPDLVQGATDSSPSGVARVASGPRWYWRALAVVVTIALYSVYRGFRVGAGRAVFERGAPVVPFEHALTVLDIEHALWLDIEQGVQDLFLGIDWLIRFCNGYYSWSHQVFTLGLVIAALMRARWHDAVRWVGAVLLLLPLGVIMFRLYPLMPPRLLDAGAPWGGRILQTHRGLRPTGIVDTLAVFTGPWTPDPVPVNGFTNQYAAMPSLHCAFSLWVGIVWWQWGKGKPWRVVGPLHAAFMFFCVVVTGNHFVLDAVAGWAMTIVLLAATNRFRWLRGFRGRLRDRALDSASERDDHESLADSSQPSAVSPA